MTPDPLQVIEVDPPQLGFGEESFPHGDGYQGNSLPLMDQKAPCVQMESVLSFLWKLFCDVSHWGRALCVQNHNRHTLVLKIISVSNMSKTYFSHAQW